MLFSFFFEGRQGVQARSHRSLGIVQAPTAAYVYIYICISKKKIDIEIVTFKLKRRRRRKKCFSSQRKRERNLVAPRVYNRCSVMIFSAGCLALATARTLKHCALSFHHQIPERTYGRAKRQEAKERGKKEEQKKKQNEKRRNQLSEFSMFKANEFYIS